MNESASQKHAELEASPEKVTVLSEELRSI